MPASYGQAYNLYDQIMRRRRMARKTRDRYGDSVTKALTGTDVPDVSGTQPTKPSTAGFAGQMSDLIGGQYIKDEAGVRPAGDSVGVRELGVAPYSQIAKEKATAYEYAVSQGVPYGVGATLSKKLGYKLPGEIVENIGVAVDPSPFAVLSGLFSGDKMKGPYGKTISVPGGVLGVAARANLKNQFEVAEKIEAGQPGFHQMRSGNNLVSIVPQNTFGFNTGYGILGSYDGTSEQAINQYASMYGYDPRSIDLMSRPEEEGFGTKLAGYDMSVASLGGFTQDGMYTAPTLGEVQPVSSFGTKAITNHMGLMSELYGASYAAELSRNLGLSDDITEGVASGRIRGNLVVVDGEAIGYETMTGGVVRDRDGDPVRGGGGVVTSGTGLVSKAAVDAARASRGGGGDGPQSQGQRDAVEAQKDEAAGLGGYADGGQVPQSDRPVPQKAQQVTEAGFVEKEPELATPAETVADDKAIDVEEGTFILNAPAVEYMGSADVKKMILDAMKEAEKQGIEVNQRNKKIPKDKLVSLVVSKGEVVIPPVLANIIGYDRLNKINNRGKQEVEKRISENGQAPEQAAQNAARGGDTRLDLDDVDHYGKFKNPFASVGSYVEQVGATLTRNTDAMEKAFTYSANYRKMHNTSDKVEDTFRHLLLGGLYGPLGRTYADFKEKEHIYATQSMIDAFSENNPLRGSFLNPSTEKIDTTKAKKINKESKIDLENNKYGGILRKQIPDEKEFARASERIMDIVRAEGIDKVPSLYDDDGKRVRLRLSTVPDDRNKK